jgi:hypothetical protein
MNSNPSNKYAYASISDMQAHLCWQQWYLHEFAARGYLNPASLETWEEDLKILANNHAWNVAVSPCIPSEHGKAIDACVVLRV